MCHVQGLRAFAASQKDSWDLGLRRLDELGDAVGEDGVGDLPEDRRWDDRPAACWLGFRRALALGVAD